MRSIPCRMILCSATLMLASINSDTRAQAQRVQPQESITQGQAQSVITDKLDNYCFFNGVEFSEGSLFCVNPGMALHCIKIKEDQKPAHWVHITPDTACAELKLR